MDPALIATLVSALAGGVAGEVGKSAWASLSSLVRRRFGPTSGELAAVESATPSSAPEISALLIDRARTDPDFHQALTEWATETAQIIRQSHDVTSTISGHARVQGNVIQAGDVFGSINLGPNS